MTARSPSAFFLSAAVHAVVVALALLMMYAVSSRVEEVPKVFELVAGEGDNYAALEAPAAGSATGIKIDIDIPERPAPKPAAVAEPEPILTPAPVEKTAEAKPKPVETIVPDFSKQITRKIIRSESKARAQVKKEREAEQKRISKLEYDRLHKATKTPPAKTGGKPKVTRIDSEGIAGGVSGGSTANKKGGAGGKALSRENGELMSAYFSLVKRRLKENLDKPPGLSDSLTAKAEFRLGADGSVSNARIITSSGSDEFDEAVLDAIRRYHSIGSRPDRKTETVNVDFKMKEED